MWITGRYTRRQYFHFTPRRRTRGQLRRLAQAWAFAIAALLVLTAAVLLLSGGGRPGFEAGSLLVCANGDGTVELYWPETTAPSALYQVEIARGGTRETRRCSRPSLILSGLPAGEELEVRVRAVADGKSLLGKARELESWKAFRAKLVLPQELEAPETTGTQAAGTVTLSWTGGGEVYEIFQTYESSSPGAAGSVPVASTGGLELTLPQEGGGQFRVRAGWKRRGFVLCGPASVPKFPQVVSPGGQALPEAAPLSLTYQETAPRLCVLEWNGAQCHHFEVRRREGDSWRTVARLAPEAHMRYAPERLGSGSWNRFQVAALDENGTELQAEEVSFWASVSPLYSTVWPIEGMNFWEDPGRNRLGSIPAGTMLCVLAEEGNWFRVRYGEDYGWVDSRYCMIDLPEYVGDYCAYDITNSYDSLFAVHGSPIRNVTHQVLPGYEHIRMPDGTFLVPYLYPCAKKLLTAAQAAQADGLRLKIYEAFRPQEATRFSYDTTQAQMNEPALTESGGQVGMSLFRLMTDNGRFGLGSFLARTISSHNRGIALDLTLENEGEELEMQSVIHDLSWYSETYRNTLNAKLLAEYMTGVGMKGLDSEWWHFQDDASRSAIGLNSALDKGVSPEGWIQDDGGWRYRRSDGSFVRSASQEVDGRLYAFDEEGYAAG